MVEFAHLLAYVVSFLFVFRFSLLISTFVFFSCSFASGHILGSTSVKECPYFSAHCELASLSTHFAFIFSLPCGSTCRTRCGSGSKTALLDRSSGLHSGYKSIVCNLTGSVLIFLHLSGFSRLLWRRWLDILACQLPYPRVLKM